MEALAATIVANFLVPYVKSGAEKLAQTIAAEAGDAAGAQAAGIAKQIWGKVRAAFGADPKKAAALEQFEEHPEAFAPGIEALLAQMLEQNDELADALKELSESSVGPGDETVVQIMADTVGYVDARGATISGGVTAGMIVERGPKEGHEQPPRGSRGPGR